jgi:WD repeat and SOF domain-containing protein 1
MWVNPGSATDVQSSEEEMMRVLQENEWSSPFLDPRFAPVIHFKLWNTAERLDSIPELAKDWRDMPSLFNSGGDVLNAKVSTPQTKGDQDDKHSVTLSDVVRFVVTHEFGGIYLDADMLLLRDWEELWGWKGAFAYRWSVHDKYNTAVLKLNKNSALGRFILRTALKNGFDFHPMSVSAYLRNAGLDRLMFQVPDALFDPAWLNAENKQRDQPPMPAFDRQVPYAQY